MNGPARPMCTNKKIDLGQTDANCLIILYCPGGPDAGNLSCHGADEHRERRQGLSWTLLKKLKSFDFVFAFLLILLFLLRVVDSP